MWRGEHRVRSERFWVAVHPVLVVLLVAALVLGWADAEVRTWLWIALGGCLVVLVTTNAWFVPELMRLVRAPDGTFGEFEWRRRARRWQMASLVRGC